MGIRVIRTIRGSASILLCIFFLMPSIVRAQTSDDLQAKINQRNQDIQALEKEIQSYQKQINALGSQADSLSATIQSLDLTQKKLAADIRVTENKIENANLTIQQLASSITGKEETIADDRRLVAHAFSTMHQQDVRSLPEILLASDSLSDAWNALDQLNSLQNDLFDRIHQLDKDKTDLESNKRKKEAAKADLVALNKQIGDQRSVVLATQAEEKQLLKETKQSQAAYRAQLAQKQALKDAFEQEILDFESQLKLSVDASKLPHTGSGVLSWPLDVIFITQYFGNTPFATANPQIYNGRGHTGVDFRATIGTPVKAALSGVVSGTGNTDLVIGCYSYGKWVMVKHDNGLSTLYAHLSLQTVKAGQEVSTGEVVGYSGNTGYTTGPHLHFGVYATQGVEIKTFDNSKNCQGAVIPIAAFPAYLNPLSYL